MSKSPKKLKQRGDRIVLRTKQTESQYFIDWINAQTNLSDSIRLLVEIEVAKNGVRDLKEEILHKRALDIYSNLPEDKQIPFSIPVSEVSGSSQDVASDNADRELVSVTSNEKTSETENKSIQQEKEFKQDSFEEAVEEGSITHNPLPVNKQKDVEDENSKTRTKRSSDLNLW